MLHISQGLRTWFSTRMTRRLLRWEWGQSIRTHRFCAMMRQHFVIGDLYAGTYITSSGRAVG